MYLEFVGSTKKKYRDKIQPLFDWLKQLSASTKWAVTLDLLAYIRNNNSNRDART